MTSACEPVQQPVQGSTIAAPTRDDASGAVPGKAGVSVGAYLHVIYGTMWGLALLWVSTLVLTVAIGFATLTPPSFGCTNGSTSAMALDVVPTAVPVITLVLAVVAAVTAITPLRPGDFPTTNVWRRKLDRLVHHH